MKHLILCILTLSVASVYGLNLEVAYDPVTNQNIIGAIDDEGRFYRHYGTDLEFELGGSIDEGSKRERGEILRWDPSSGYYIQGKRWAWITSGDPCPGMGPFELLLHWDQRTENWNFFALDGEGQLYTITNVSWNPKGEPVPGPPPYQLSSAQDPKVAGVFPITLDGEGRLWFFDTPAFTWEPYPFGGAYTGAVPTDFLAMTTPNFTAFWETNLVVIDETGRISQSTQTGWEEYAQIPGGTAPYRLDGFAKTGAVGWVWMGLRVLDGEGRLFRPWGDVFEPLGEPCNGTPPWDLTVYRMESRGTHVIFVVDSTGALFLLRPNGEWELLIRSFE